MRVFLIKRRNPDRPSSVVPQSGEIPYSALLGFDKGRRHVAYWENLCLRANTSTQTLKPWKDLTSGIKEDGARVVVTSWHHRGHKMFLMWRSEKYMQIAILVLCERNKECLKNWMNRHYKQFNKLNTSLKSCLRSDNEKL